MSTGITEFLHFFTASNHTTASEGIPWWVPWVVIPIGGSLWMWMLIRLCGWLEAKFCPDDPD